VSHPNGRGRAWQSVTPCGVHGVTGNVDSLQDGVLVAM
jgi:hypothetical protein